MKVSAGYSSVCPTDCPSDSLHMDQKKVLRRIMRQYRFSIRFPSLSLRTKLSLFSLVCLVSATSQAATQAVEVDEDRAVRGKHLYVEHCASCHGETGQGVDGGYTSILTGDATISELTKVIHETMPEGEPEKCVDDDARMVAEYIHEAFYSVEAQNRLNPPKQSFARLTGTQLQKSISDLYGHFSGFRAPVADRGIRGRYFNAERMKKEEEKITRTDPYIDFDFGREGPGEGISPEGFYIYWEGSLLPERSGLYEIVIHSSCSFRFSLGRLDRELIDNHVQSGDKTEFRQSVYLTAGRLYPFKIDFVQRKRKTEQPPANIRLGWVPPHGVEETIPERNLVPVVAPGAFSLQMPLPPDDRSYGFERGIAINKQWDESTTAAALDFANIATLELFPRFSRELKDLPNENRAHLKSFLKKLLDVAFRGTLSDDVSKAYIDQQLEAIPDDADAIKRVVLLSLKSPRFLYPLADNDQSRSRRAANRLALVLYDSLPSDPWLIQAIEKGELDTEEQIRSAAKKMMQDYRAQAKLREAIYEWLNLGSVTEISKSSSLYPGFDQGIVQELRKSLDAQIDEIAFGPDSDFRQFFISNVIYTSQKLADLYGDEWALEPVEESKPTPKGLVRKEAASGRRFGILTHPLLLSSLAYHDSTSPIHRGVYLLRYALGRVLRPPTDAFSPLSPDLHPDLSTRERVALQTSSQNCQICHIKINPLGFVLESYDAIGKFRTEDRSKPVDTSGAYRSRSDEVTEFQTAEDLANYLANSADAHRSFVTRMFQHMVKQPADAFGPETLKKLTDRFVNDRYNIQDLAVEIAVVASQTP